MFLRNLKQETKNSPFTLKKSIYLIINFCYILIVLIRVRIIKLYTTVKYIKLIKKNYNFQWLLMF